MSYSRFAYRDLAVGAEEVRLADLSVWNDATRREEVPLGGYALAAAGQPSS